LSEHLYEQKVNIVIKVKFLTYLNTYVEKNVQNQGTTTTKENQELDTTYVDGLFDIIHNQGKVKNG
jgi:hypothetical protein